MKLNQLSIELLKKHLMLSKTTAELLGKVEDQIFKIEDDNIIINQLPRIQQLKAFYNVRTAMIRRLLQKAP